jgi:hypothetical protein
VIAGFDCGFRRLRSKNAARAGSASRQFLRSVAGIEPAVAYFVHVLAQPLEHGVRLALRHLPFYLSQSKMHDVVMMDFLAGQFIAQFQPHPMQQINFIGREPRSVWT